jgi:hypothetical protein
MKDGATFIVEEPEKGSETPRTQQPINLTRPSANKWLDIWNPKPLTSQLQVDHDNSISAKSPIEQLWNLLA